MASGLPVATNVGGIPSQVINNKTGFLIELNNIEELKNKILLLAESFEKRLEMSLASREKVQLEHSWQKSALDVKNLYEDNLKSFTYSFQYIKYHARSMIKKDACAKNNLRSYQCQQINKMIKNAKSNSPFYQGIL